MKWYLLLVYFFMTNILTAQSYLETSKIVASDRESGEEFGNAVDISGNYAVVGNYKESENENGIDSLPYAGAVYVYEKQSSGSWLQVQKLVSSDRAANDEFGFSVAISGNYIVVGARSEDEDASGANTLAAAGSAYIFERNTSGVWNQIQKLVPNHRQIALQWAWDVEIDGDYIAVGSYRDNTDENGLNSLNGNAGGLNVFEKNSSGLWVEVQKIVASDRASHEWFSYDIEIEGAHMVVGAAGINHVGKVYAFTRNSAGIWNEDQILTGSDIVSGSNFGEVVSLNGNYIVVGARKETEDENGINTLNNSGAVYIYKDSSGSWIEDQKIVASDRTTFDYFGSDVSMDDSVVTVGAFFGNSAFSGTTVNSAGAVYRFELNALQNWEEKEKLEYSDVASGDMFGEHVAISNGVIIASARAEDEDEYGLNTLNASGSAYIFTDCRTYNEIYETACVSYISPSGSYTWNSSGSYQDTLVNSVGCDSVLTIHLTVYQVTFGVDSLSACDSLTWINGITYTTSNTTATDTLVNALGCDSIVTLHLTIKNSTSGIDSIDACDEIIWIDGQLYTTNNSTATHILTNAAGCDSLVTLNLTIHTIDNSVSQNGVVLTANQSGAMYQWLDCDNDNLPILGATGQTYTATSNGNYAVNITDIYGCSLVSSCYSVTSAKVNESNEHNFLSVFPNPTNGIFKIEFGRQISTGILIINDISGKEILKEYVSDKSGILIEIEKSPGVYFVTLRTENEHFITKLILN